MENTEFVKKCQSLQVNDIIYRDKLTFEELFNLKYPVETKIDPKWMLFWSNFHIFAKTNKEFKMNVWNGKHPVDKNSSVHICTINTKVIIWMVSRFGDVGITDNLINPKGYDCRIECEDLYDWEIIKIK
jgi:hypothetical protein